MTGFEKKRLVLFQQLQGAGYHNALAAYRFANQYHTGKRKDGVSEEFLHQIEIGLFALLLPDVRYREEVLATIALHDVREDAGVSDLEIRGIFQGTGFADVVADAVDAMTKKFRGTVRPQEALFEAMSLDPIASIAKACDRQHNVLSMGGVFSAEKQRSYIAEVRELFLPMIKRAKHRFPDQIRAYELLKFNLTSQITLLELALDATVA